jgi:hypothetical protein
MLHLMTSFFNAGFYFPGYNWTSILLAIAIGVVFGGIWLFLYRPPNVEKTGCGMYFYIGAFPHLGCRVFYSAPPAGLDKRRPGALVEPANAEHRQVYLTQLHPHRVLSPGLCRKPPKSPPFSFSGSAIKMILRPNWA